MYDCTTKREKYKAVIFKELIFLKSKKKKAEKLWHGDKIPSDVEGSYTGIGEKGQPPVQDADDL